MKQLIFVLMLIAFSIWISVFTINPNLQIIACDVGQGDAILIQKKTTQILLDGGPNSKVLNCLGRYMPFWDRRIEMVINTHPEADHYTGLIDVLKNYKVDHFGTNGTTSSSQGYKVLESLVGGNGIPTTTLTTGTTIKADLIYLDILNPITNNTIINNQTKNKSTNNDGVVILLKYGQFEALFTADVENEVSNKLAELEKVKDLDYIKVNHHGSRNGMTENLLKAVSPKFAVISSGYRNSYGHPHEEIIKMLQKYDVKILRTDLPANATLQALQTGEVGDVVLETDGEKYWY